LKHEHFEKKLFDRQLLALDKNKKESLQLQGKQNETIFAVKLINLLEAFALVLYTLILFV